MRMKYLSEQCYALSQENYMNLNIESIKKSLTGYYFDTYSNNISTYVNISHIRSDGMSRYLSAHCVIKTNKDSEMIEDIYYVID